VVRLRRGGAPGGGWRRMGLQQGLCHGTGQPWLVAEVQGWRRGRLVAGAPRGCRTASAALARRPKVMHIRARAALLATVVLKSARCA